MSNAGLSTNVEELHAMIVSMEDEIRRLKEQLALATHHRFGKKSEGFSPDQLPLFITPDVELIIEEKEVEEPSPPEPKKKRKVRQAVIVNKDTEVESIELDLDDSEKTCDCCQGALHKIGEDRSLQVEYIPHKTKVIATVRPKYACRQCEIGIKQKSLPPSLIPKSMATASLIAFLIVSKFVDHLPLNRIQRMLSRVGIQLPRSTQSQWLLKVASQCQPLIELMRVELLKSPQVFTDDTILPLQNDDKTRNSLIQSRLWVYATQQKTGPPIILYDFTRTREKQGPQTFLHHYQGYVQADAYSGYDGLYANGAKEVACMAHCRRYFEKASLLEEIPGPAYEALMLIKRLYKIEREIKHFTDKKRKKYRRLKAKPQLKKFKRWLDSKANRHLPKNKLGQAIQYALNNWNALTRYCEAGYLEIDNNFSEREMRPVALGRKNYLFRGSEKGGEATAIFYSLVESAKVNQLNIYSYLKSVLEQLPTAATKAELNALLPYNWKKNQP